MDKDSSLLRQYDSLFTKYKYSEPDSVIYFSRQGLTKFIEHRYQRGIAGMLSILAGTYSDKGMLDIAEKAANEALNINSALHNVRGIADDEDILGVIYGKKSNYAAAIGNFLAALRLFEQVGDSSGMSDTYIKLGVASAFSNYPDKALQYYNEGLALQRNKPVNDIVIFLHNNIGDVYYGKNDYQNAIKYFQLAFDESDSPKFASLHALPVINLAAVYSDMGDDQRANCYNEQALQVSDRLNLPADKIDIMMNMAKLIGKTDPGRAIDILNNALVIAGKGSYKSLESEVLDALAEQYANKGDYKQASAILARQKAISDSVFSTDKQKAIANIEALYDLDKLSGKVKTLELQQAQQASRSRSIITGTAFIGIIALILFIYFRKTSYLNAELKVREAKLNRANMIKNKLISIIGHDLSGTMRFMPLALRLSKNRNIPAHEKEALITQIEQNASASYETLQNMLNWGKVQIQGVSLNREFFNAAESVDEVLKFINIAAHSKQVRIANQVGNVMIYADINHFKFVLRNLLSNAVKFSYRNSDVAVGMQHSADGSFAIFSVTDHGDGIPEDKKKKIFDSFGESASGTESEKGSGIALPICREFVTENGGAIWVDSVPGQGTTFYFSVKTKTNAAA